MTFEEFVKKYNIVDPYSNIYPDTKYDYVSAWKAGVAPKLIDGKLKWPSKFKHDDSPERYINGFDTKNFKEGIKMSEYDAVTHNSPPTEQEIRRLNSYEYGRNPTWVMNELLKEFGYIPENGHSQITQKGSETESKMDFLQNPLLKMLLGLGTGPMGVAGLNMLHNKANGHSNIDTLIEQDEYGPIKPNALMETSMAYQNPNAILKHLLPSKGNDTLLEDVIDMALRNDTKGLSDRLPPMEQTRGETGGLINALLRGIRTGSYERKKSPLLDELK